MGLSLALTLGGVVSFLLNMIGFLPLLINKIDPIFGQQLKDLLISLLQKIPQEQIAWALVGIVSLMPTTAMLSVIMWAFIALLIAGFFAMFKGFKGILIGGIIATLVIMYVTGQFGAFFGASVQNLPPTNSTGVP